ncbi:MAG: hypothetical protein ACR2MS_07115 [Weeksellaceae bacterium]
MIKNLFICTLSILLFATCANSKMNNNADNASDTHKEVPMQTVTFEELTFNEHGSGTPSQNTVFHNALDFDNAWKQAHSKMKPIPAVPKVDFDKESVLFIDFGQRTHGGAIYKVKDVMIKADTAIVSTSKPSSDPDKLYTTVMTRPFMFIKINSTKVNLVSLK